MAADVTSRLWEIGDIVDVLEALGSELRPLGGLEKRIMDCSKLSKSELSKALRKNKEALANIRNRQAAPANLNFPPLFQIALTEADDAVAAKIKRENKELEAELFRHRTPKVPPQSK